MKFEKELIIKPTFNQLVDLIVSEFGCVDFRASEVVHTWLDDNLMDTISVGKDWDENAKNRFIEEVQDWLRKDYIYSFSILNDLLQCLCMAGKIEPGTYLIQA